LLVDDVDVVDDVDDVVVVVDDVVVVDVVDDVVVVVDVVDDVEKDYFKNKKRKQREPMIKKDDRKSRYFWNAPEVAESSHSKNKIKESHKTLNIGFIGVGGMGIMSLKEIIDFEDLNIIAFADVDLSHLEEVKKNILEKRPDTDVQTFQDFRDLTKLDNLDAIIISTPDHWHVPAAINALEHGKHIYVEKPLTLTVAEGRELVNTVKKTGLVCQTGTQQRSSSEFRLACELVRNNKIGDVKEIHVLIPKNNVKCDKTWSPMPIPKKLDYDMWLGQAPWEEYTEQRCHYSFRFILAYSGGQMTNWGAHHLDIVQWALDMDDSGPVAVSGKGIFPKEGLFDTAMEIDLLYEYADGTKLTCQTADTRGIEFIGSKGKVNVRRGEIKTEPESLVGETFDKEDDIKLYVSTNHYQNFFDCVRQNKTPIATAETGHRSATLCHLGNIAMTLNRKLQWDPQAEQFINDDEANSMLSRPPRKTF